MKTSKLLSVLLIVLVVTLASCVPTPEKHFDLKHLYGEWVEGTVHDKYAEDGTGYSWDTADDISEEEALPFEWRLSYDTLQVNHIEWNGAIVPKIYIVTALDSVRFDNYDLVSGAPHHYNKVVVP